MAAELGQRAAEVGGDADLVQLAVEPLDLAPPDLVDGFGREIEAGDDRSQPSGRHRNDTGAARDIEHAVAGPNAGVAHEARRWRGGH